MMRSQTCNCVSKFNKVECSGRPSLSKIVEYIGHIMEVEENITDMVWSIVWYICHAPWKSDIYWENTNWRKYKTWSHFSICFFRVMQQLYRIWQINDRLFWSSSSTEKRNSVLNALDSYCSQSRSYLVTTHVNCSIFSTFF